MMHKPVVRFQRHTNLYHFPGSIKRIVSLIDQGLLKPLLAKSFPLKELAKAQEVFIAKKHIGNIVVTLR